MNNERKLRKSNKGKVLCGVCAGLGEYAGMDPVIIRLALVLFCFAGGAGLLVYLLAALIMPPAEE